MGDRREAIALALLKIESRIETRAYDLKYYVLSHFILILFTEYLAQYVVSVRAFNEAGRSEVVYDIVYTGDKQSGYFFYMTSVKTLLTSSI